MHADLAGIVIAADPSYEEPPDIQPLRLLFLAIYSLPLLFFLPMVFGILLGLAIILRIVGLRGFSPFQWITLIMLNARTGGRERRVPVRNIRLRDQSGTEHQVRIKAVLQGGTVDRGDTLLVRGRRRDGVWHLHRGFNYRTNSAIVLRSDMPFFLLFLATLGWFLIASLALRTTGR